MAALVARGHPPYRLGVQSMNAAPRGTGMCAALLSYIKQIVDPFGNLAPRRYTFGDPAEF